MASTIDRRYPLNSDATCQYETRRNFQSAADDIEALQALSPEDRYQDYLTPGSRFIRIGANVPTIEPFKTWMRLVRFDNGVGASAIREAWFDIHILHDIKAGTSPTLHVHWTHENATPSGDVKWNIDWQVRRGYGVGTFTDTPTQASTVQTAGADGAHMITPDDIIVTYSEELEPDSYLFGRLWRDPGDAEDTFEDNVFLIGVDMHYQMGQSGTIERNRPFTGWPVV